MKIKDICQSVNRTWKDTMKYLWKDRMKLREMTFHPRFLIFVLAFASIVSAFFTPELMARMNCCAFYLGFFGIFTLYNVRAKWERDLISHNSRLKNRIRDLEKELETQKKQPISGKNPI